MSEIEVVGRSIMASFVVTARLADDVALVFARLGYAPSGPVHVFRIRPSVVPTPPDHTSQMSAVPKRHSIREE